MSLQDPIADMLTRIRNVQMRNFPDVVMPSSKMKANIAKVLLEEGYIKSFEVIEHSKVKKNLYIKLKYHRGEPVIKEIRRVSKPSLRQYRDLDSMPSVRGGLGIAIVSTSKGVVTSQKAKQLGVGGEVLCTVY